MFKVKTGPHLTALELHNILKIRNEVFIVEQQCQYYDIDNLDLLPETVHIFTGTDSDVEGYARILYTKPGIVKIGRVVVCEASRSTGLGKKLLNEVLQYIRTNNPGMEIVIHAQYYLLNWYAKFGFNPRGEPFDDAGVKHIEMYIEQ